MKQIPLLEVFLLLFYRRKDKPHLFGIRDLTQTIVAWDGFVEEHWSELGVHNLLADHSIDCIPNVPFVYTFVIE